MFSRRDLLGAGLGGVSECGAVGGLLLGRRVARASLVGSTSLAEEVVLVGVVVLRLEVRAVHHESADLVLDDLRKLKYLYY
jgi:hypothetical protein